MNRKDAERLINRKRDMLIEQIREERNDKICEIRKQTEEKRENLIKRLNEIANTEGFSLNKYGAIYVETSKEEKEISAIAQKEENAIIKQADDLLTNIILLGIKDNDVVGMLKKYLGM